MQKIAGYIFSLFLLGNIYAQPYLKIQKINANNYPYVNLEVSVSNAAPIENLNETNFSVFENGWKAGYFRIKKTEPEKNPKRVVLLVDSSLSLSKQAFESQIQAAIMLVNSIYKNDELSVISFHDSPEVRCGFTSSREQLTNCIKEIKQNGKNTVLFDSIFKAMEMLSDSEFNRNFIVLFTDGKDEKSGIKIEDLINYEDKSPLFIVGTGKNSNLNRLSRIAHISGGEIYNSGNLKNIGKIFSLLQVLIDNTYQLEYISHGDERLEKNHVEVRFEYNELRDQDQGSFGIEKKSFWGSIKSTLEDERFIFFIVVSILLIVIIIVLVSKSKSNETFGALNTQSVEKNKLVVKNREKKSAKVIPSSLKVPNQKEYAYIIQKEGPMTGNTNQIKFETTTIGHGNENSIVIDDPTVSYTHAKLVKKENNFYIYDMLSESGVYVNGKKILRPKLLNDFDEIKIGRTLLLFRKAYK